MDSTGLGFDMFSSVRRTLTDGTCSEHDGRGCRCTTTYETFNLRGREEGARAEVDTLAVLRAAEGGSSRSYIFSAAASPAKTCPSPDNAEDSRVTDPGCSSSSPGSLSLFDPDGFSSRTYPVSSLATAVGTSEQSLERWPTSGTAWAGGFSTHVSSECRSDDGGCSSSEPSLTQILEPPLNVPAKYSLSARAARGILRRAERRGKRLPDHLAAALAAVASEGTNSTATVPTCPYCAPDEKCALCLGLSSRP